MALSQMVTCVHSSHVGHFGEGTRPSLPRPKPGYPRMLLPIPASPAPHLLFSKPGSHIHAVLLQVPLSMPPTCSQVHLDPEEVKSVPQPTPHGSSPEIPSQAPKFQSRPVQSPFSVQTNGTLNQVPLQVPWEHRGFCWEAFPMSPECPTSRHHSLWDRNQVSERVQPPLHFTRRSEVPATTCHFGSEPQGFAL